MKLYTGIPQYISLHIPFKYIQGIYKYLNKIQVEKYWNSFQWNTAKSWCIVSERTEKIGEKQIPF